MIWTLIQVAIGGALGAVSRYGTVQVVAKSFGSSFPYGTLLVNVGGSLLMGFLFVALSGSRLSPLFLTGFLGGFTTFSAFSLDAVRLWEEGQITAAAVYIGTSIALSILGLVVGLLIARSVLS